MKEEEKKKKSFWGWGIAITYVALWRTSSPWSFSVQARSMIW